MWVTVVSLNVVYMVQICLQSLFSFIALIHLIYPFFWASKCTEVNTISALDYRGSGILPLISTNLATSLTF